MKCPNIGETVRRLDNNTRDAVVQRRIDHGPNPQDAEHGVLWWHKARARWRGEEWKEEILKADGGP